MKEKGGAPMKWMFRDRQFVAITEDGQELVHDIAIRQHECGA